MDKVKVAIIGTGSISNFHIGSYLKNPNIELYAFCDIDEERLNMMGDKYGVERRYTDKDVMLRELPEIDAVSVCTWNSEHAACTIAALNAGCHVLCEKPMATTTEEAEAMRAAAEKNGKLLMIGFVRRFGDDCKIMEEFLENDYFGDIYYGKAIHLRRHGAPGGWFGDKARSAGGPLIDLGVHIIDLTRYLLGNPKPVSVYGATFHKLANRPDIKTGRGVYRSSTKVKNVVFDVEDLATAMIRYENGAVISVETSFSLNTKNDVRRIELFGTKAGATFDPSLEILGTVGPHMSNVNLVTPTAFSFDGLFEREIDHFIDCVQNGTKCKNPAEDGIEIMKILEAIYESASTGHEVIIK